MVNSLQINPIRLIDSGGVKVSDNLTEDNNLNVNPITNSSESLFQSTINSLLSTNLSKSELVTSTIQHYLNNNKIDENDLLALEKTSGDFSDEISIISKVVGLATKFINELTHLQ